MILWVCHGIKFCGVHINIQYIAISEQYLNTKVQKIANRSGWQYIYIHLSPLSSEIVDNYEVIARQVTTTRELDKARQLPAWRDYQDKNKILQEKCFISKKHRWHTWTFDAIWFDKTWLFVWVRRLFFFSLDVTFHWWTTSNYKSVFNSP